MTTGRTIRLPGAEINFGGLPVRGASTPTSRDQQTDWLNQWAGRALSEHPADRPRAERAVSQFYKAVGLPPPSVFVWVKSPKPMRQIRKTFEDVREGKTSIKRFDFVQSVGQRLGKNKRPYWDDLIGERMGVLLNNVARAVDNTRSSNRIDGAMLRGIVWDNIGTHYANYIWHKEIDPQSPAITRRRNPDSVGVFSGLAAGQWRADLAASWVFSSTIQGKRYSPDVQEVIEAYASLVAAGSYWIPYRCFCVMCERPSRIALDDRIRLHHEKEVAIQWPDGFGSYFLAGLGVPDQIIRTPSCLTVQRIEEEQNAELRRCYITLYGEKRYLDDSGAVVVSHGRDGVKLWSRKPRNNMSDPNFSADPFQMVEVINSTAEPNGEFRHYFLRVPPDVQTADEGVAWTFGVEPRNYNPEKET